MTDTVFSDNFIEDVDVDMILPPEIDFSGTLCLEKSFSIQGRVSGEINAKELLVVEEEAVVNANINASRAVIRGFVKGDVTASEKIYVAVTGRLEGNIAAPEILLESGCVFNGCCTMKRVEHGDTSPLRAKLPRQPPSH